MPTSQIAPLQYRVVTKGHGYGYFVISFPASYGGADVRAVPNSAKRSVAGPYTSAAAAQKRASDENWRRQTA